MNFLNLEGLVHLYQKVISLINSRAILRTPQELTLEEVNQVRENIHSAGQHAGGLTYTPYTVVEEGLNTDNYTITEVPGESTVADEGAEIYNDYANNIATGLYSTAEGYKTQAIAPYAKSSGWWTKASGQGANAEGMLSVASGNFAHAEGTRTIAAGKSQHVEGAANIEDNNDQYIHIAGNGADSENRSNAHTLDWDGNAWFAGDLYVGSTSGTNKDEGSQKVATENYVENLYQKLNSNTILGFYCIEPVTIVTNGISKVYPANSNVEVAFIEGDTFEIIPTSDNSILQLNAFPGALGTYYSWLEGVKQFSNILFDMNTEDMYVKWNQNNQGSYQVQFAQYINCIFWSDLAYIHEISKRTNYTLYYSSQLPLCYSNIPDNTFKAFFLAFGVNSDPNWGNSVYRESFAKATWPTQVFSYYGARTIGVFGHDSASFNIILPPDCRGLMYAATAVENAGTFDAANVTNFGAKSGSWRDAFGWCLSLRQLYIKNLKVNLNISWSPINYDSISSIISAAANTSAITISVSPYTYYLLSDADFELAASKNITIELITTNYVEDRRLATIDAKANQADVEDLLATKVNVENPVMSGTMGLNHTGELGFASVSLGFANEASGMYCFSEGMGNKSTGDSSHTEGTGNTASRDAAHAEGYGTNASNVGAHAEGANTVASGYGSHAEGSGTIASIEGQHVEGRYNIEDTSAVHIVGNGTSSSKRSNAHTIDSNGEAWYAGDVYVKSTSGTNKDEGSKKLATEEYVNNTVNSLPTISIEQIDLICKTPTNNEEEV